MSVLPPPVLTGRSATPRAMELPRRAAAVLAAVVLLVAAGVRPASAHYVQPPGELEAAAAVVLVDIVSNYAVTLPGDAGLRKPYPARVQGPRGTGAVVNSAGAVLTGKGTALHARTQQEEIAAINQAFRARHSLPWTDAQLAQRQRVRDADINGALQKCYARPGTCANFKGRTRSVVFNTDPERRLNSRYVEINENLSVLNIRFDRDRTPTVGISATPPQADGLYKAMGWDEEGSMLPPLSVTFAGDGLKGDDLQKVAATFANGGDGVVIVDSKSKGNVIAVVRKGADGQLAVVDPMGPLQFAGIGSDRGPLHPSIDEAIGYFNGKHYTHSLPLLEEVVKLIPDRGLLRMVAEANEKAGSPEDRSNDPSESMSPPVTNRLTWTLVAAAIAVVGAAAVAALLLLRRRRRSTAASVVPASPTEEWDDDGDSNQEFEDLMEGESVSIGSEADDRAHEHAAGDFRMEPAGQLHPMAATTVKSIGAGQPSGTYCSQCGVGLTAGDRFCYHCGNPAR